MLSRNEAWEKQADLVRDEARAEAQRAASFQLSEKIGELRKLLAERKQLLDDNERAKAVANAALAYVQQVDDGEWDTLYKRMVETLEAFFGRRVEAHPLPEQLGDEPASSPNSSVIMERVGPVYTYASMQATKCAMCGVHKHTPLRRDELGGYVCLTCVDQRLDLLGEDVARLTDARDQESAQRAVTIQTLERVTAERDKLFTGSIEWSNMHAREVDLRVKAQAQLATERAAREAAEKERDYERRRCMTSDANACAIYDDRLQKLEAQHSSLRTAAEYARSEGARLTLPNDVHARVPHAALRMLAEVLDTSPAAAPTEPDTDGPNHHEHTSDLCDGVERAVKRWPIGAADNPGTSTGPITTSSAAALPTDHNGTNPDNTPTTPGAWYPADAIESLLEVMDGGSDAAIDATVTMVRASKGYAVRANREASPWPDPALVRELVNEFLDGAGWSRCLSMAQRLRASDPSAKGGES